MRCDRRTRLPRDALRKLGIFGPAGVPVGGYLRGIPGVFHRWDRRPAQTPVCCRTASVTGAGSAVPSASEQREIRGGGRRPV